MKLKWFVVMSAILVITGTVFSLPQRVVRSVGERPVMRERGVFYPHIAEPEDTLAYEDPDDIPNFMTLPNDYDDRYYNVRFTPPYAPFQIYAIHIPLFDMFGEQGTPGMEITIWESGEQDGENGYPTELITTVEVSTEDLVFGGADPVFNVIDISELNLTFNDEVEFHIAIDVIADEETDTLGIYMDDGEFVEDSRSGLFLGEDEEEEFPWIRIQDLEGMLPYNYAIHAVIGDPNDAPSDFAGSIEVGAHRTILIYPAYPNPFNDYTTVKINVPQGMYFKAHLIDQSGRQIQQVFEGVGNGDGLINIQAGSYPAGNYFLQLSSAFENSLIRLIYLK